MSSDASARQTKFYRTTARVDGPAPDPHHADTMVLVGYEPPPKVGDTIEGPAFGLLCGPYRPFKVIEVEEVTVEEIASPAQEVVEMIVDQPTALALEMARAERDYERAKAARIAAEDAEQAAKDRLEAVHRGRVKQWHDDLAHAHAVLKQIKEGQ